MARTPNESQAPGSPKLQNLMAQIDKLQAEAEKVKEKEKNDVVGRIKQAIEVYGIQPGELFAKRPYQSRIKHAARAPVATKTKKAAKKAAKKPAKRVRRFFTDEQKMKLVTQHAALVTGGLTHSAASTKLGLVDTLVRGWYRKFPPAAAA